jgi:hypothetical protein
VAAIGVAVTIYPRLRWISIYEDQGVLSGMAMQVAAGQVPYRDFDTSIAPASMFMYGAYYKLVGASVVHQRLITGAAMVLGVWLVARIGRRVLPPWWAAGVALLWGVWLPVFQEFSPYHFWSLTLILAMSAALLEARTARHPRRMFVLAGFAAAAALMMLQASLLAVVAGLVVATVIEKDWRRSLLPMLAALVVPGLLMLAALTLLGALPSFIADAVVYNIKVFGPNQMLPFPWQPALLHDTSFWEASVGALWAIPMHWLLAVVAPIPVAIATAVAVWKHRGSLDACPDWVLIGILAAGLFASVLLLHMSDQNLWLCAPLTLLLVTMRVKQTVVNSSSRRIMAAAVAAPLVIIYLTGLSPLVLGYALVCHTDGTGFLRQVDAREGPICVTFDSAPIVTAATKFTSQHPDSAIAFLPAAPSLYEITERVPPVPDALLLVPGITTPEQLARVENAMRGLPVEWVVYYKIDFTRDLPSDRALQNGSPFQFDQFLSSAYERADQDGLVLYRLKR